MTIEISFTLSVQASSTWKVDPDSNADEAPRRRWSSEKVRGPYGHKFQLKLCNTTFKTSSGRTYEMSHLLLRNCQMRKVLIERVDLCITIPGEEKRITTKLASVALKRSGVFGCGTGTMFDKNLCPADVTIDVKIHVGSDPQSKLKDDLQRSLMAELTNPFFADTTLEVGDAELKCHGFMLAARSKVFKAYLMQNGFSEGKSRRIKVPDMSLDSAVEFLKFIYTDSFDADEDNIFDLFFAAEKYDIPQLKKECEAILMDDLDVESAAECFQLAFLCRSDQLLEKSAQIIAENLDEVQETAGWKAMDEKSSKQVFQEVAKCQGSESLTNLVKNFGI